jgi:xylulose-5-phosphate/fructose-6-phosphate phosphoketolase
MGANPHANGRQLLKDLIMPNFCDYAVEVSKPGTIEAEATRVMGDFLRDVMKLNADSKNFRVMSPDENNSNRWNSILDETNRSLPADSADR